MTSEVLDLGAAGIDIFAGQLFHHDYLWFSSFEISKVTRTAPIIHNYALSYAVSGYGYGIYTGSRPSYDADLSAMAVYTTPARPGILEAPRWTRFTQNAIDNRTLQTKGPPGVNSPSLGWRIVLNPCWDVGTIDHGFTFYAFVKRDYVLPTVVRLGKKGCPVRLKWTRIATARATRITTPLDPTHAINPLDVNGNILSYEPISIPPHLVFRQAQISDDWFVFDGRHRIHIPSRFTAAGAAPLVPRAPNPERKSRRRAR